MNAQVALPSGETVPALGQGTWQMAEKESRRPQEIEALRLGVELGMTLIDTAEMYGEGASEELIAEALAEGSGKPVWMTRPVTSLMRERGRPCSTRVELFDGRHRDEVCAQVIIGAIASSPQPRRQAIDEALCPRTEPVARWDER